METIQIPGLEPVPPLGLGTWQWGDRLFWGYGKGYKHSDLEAAFEESLAAGVRLFDTAEVYGMGRSERFLGRFVRESGQRPLVVSKCFPFPWRFSRKSLIAALRGSLKRLELPRLDLYLLHWPWPPVPLEQWAEALAEAYELGLTRAVGVSNCDLPQMERVTRALARHGVKLAANQVEYSLLERKPEREGLLEAMRREGVVLMAYSPLGMGWLTGKYSPHNPPTGPMRGRKYRLSEGKIPGLLEALREVAQAHQATPAQVAIRWCIQKGTLPIPGAKTAAQARSNARALHLCLGEAEMRRLEQASA
ncbi:putative oxidoreductase [Calidithermus terrae]|uniref:Putative oxidoreductase n=1 Tax=Calidithermus terrae TaxID=1408545 RepID=A0A399ELK0_9DEIN|nr:aldo/keto reductase [Calidithermus terrae]RIH84353.1 putative oxidoreductase [Calidithermus terrae]